MFLEAIFIYHNIFQKPMELSPEVKAQLEEQKKNCIFCKILAGEVESNKVYEDKLMYAILDINPVAKAHALFMPKEHYPILPYLPAETFKHIFGLMPKITKAMQDAMLCSGVNVLIANGAVAGQNAPHFLIHIFPRENRDGLNKYELKGNNVDKAKVEQIKPTLANNLPIMMRNHFGRNPAEWNKGTKGEFNVEGFPLYQDEKAICVLPENPMCAGHMIIYGNQDFDEMDSDTSSHLFYVASFAATAAFEGLGAHGTNIILKNGISDDNPDGKLSIHVLPRYQEDGLDLILPPLEDKPDLDETASRIKDKLFYVQHSQETEKKIETINLDEKEIETIGAKKAPSHKNEIDDAINKIISQ